MKAILRAIAAAGAAALAVGLHRLLDFFAGPAPADVPVMLWALVAAAAVYGLNWLVAKLPLGDVF